MWDFRILDVEFLVVGFFERIHVGLNSAVGFQLWNFILESKCGISSWLSGL